MKSKRKLTSHRGLERLKEIKRLKRMGKYLEAVGVWKHSINGMSHEVVPQMEDNDKIAGIIASYQKDKNTANLLKQLRLLYVELVKRSNPTIQGEEEKEMNVWASVNQMEIMNEQCIPRCIPQ